MAQNKLFKSLFSYCLMIICSLISVFFVFYTVRLFYITKGLSNIKVGGKGTYIGAIAFPVLALIFGLFSWHFYKAIRKIDK